MADHHQQTSGSEELKMARNLILVVVKRPHFSYRMGTEMVYNEVSINVR